MVNTARAATFNSENWLINMLGNIFKSLIIVGTLTYCLAGCAPTKDVRGYIFNSNALEGLTPGTDNQESVLRSLGTPSALGTFNHNAWYYISRVTESFAFLNEEVIDQRVVAIIFDDKGILESIHYFGMEDAVDLTPVEQKTPTRGRELNIFEQLLSNINRFDRPIE